MLVQGLMTKPTMPRLNRPNAQLEARAVMFHVEQTVII
jgi:hypothetical protein